jgi:rSAM/selenodomain-associated transferase 2
MAGISIIVPAKNEELVIRPFLAHLAALRPHEIIVVDGHSADSTVALASRHARVISTSGGRGPQMNAGAAAATGDILLFLHADVQLGPDALAAMSRAMETEGAIGGNFDITFQGGWEAAIFSWINRFRCRFGIFYGDSGIFCRRDVFERLGGFKPWPVMEDYEFVRRLGKVGRLALLEAPIYVSPRRWREDGLWRTLWFWFWIQALYLAGVSPYTLARWYRDVRGREREPAF